MKRVSEGYFMVTGFCRRTSEVWSKDQRRITHYLQAKVEQLHAAGIEKVSFVAAEGRGAEEIIDLAQRTTDNLVAMSTHGRSGMGVGFWVASQIASCATAAIPFWWSARPPHSLKRQREAAKSRSTNRSLMPGGSW